MSASDIPSQPASDRQVTTRIARSPAEMEAVYDIRREVFVREQHLARTVYDEPDDENSVHLLAYLGGNIIGTGRGTILRDEMQIAWVAVRKSYRGSGAGRAMMSHLMNVAREENCTVVTLNAQTHALSFYESFGFVGVGRRFRMAKIEHQYMMCDLTGSDTI